MRRQKGKSSISVALVAGLLVSVVLVLPFVIALAANLFILWRSGDSLIDLAAVDDAARPSTDDGSWTALVLGARVFGTEPSPVLQDRLATALELYRRKWVDRILVSGDHGRVDYDEVNVMRAWLVRQGVPSEVVFMDHAGFRTLDSMARARAVFKVRRALVVSQRFHLPRALFLARHFGLEARGVIADRREYEHAPRDSLREFVARARAVLDVYVLRAGPRYLGATIPVESAPAEDTFDESTRDFFKD